MLIIHTRTGRPISVEFYRPCSKRLPAEIRAGSAISAISLPVTVFTVRCRCTGAFMVIAAWLIVLLQLGFFFQNYFIVFIEAPLMDGFRSRM